MRRIVPPRLLLRLPDIAVPYNIPEILSRVPTVLSQRPLVRPEHVRVPGPGQVAAVPRRPIYRRRYLIPHRPLLRRNPYGWVRLLYGAGQHRHPIEVKVAAFESEVLFREQPNDRLQAPPPSSVPAHSSARPAYRIPSSRIRSPGPGRNAHWTARPPLPRSPQ